MPGSTSNYHQWWDLHCQQDGNPASNPILLSIFSNHTYYQLMKVGFHGSRNQDRVWGERCLSGINIYERKKKESRIRQRKKSNLDNWANMAVSSGVSVPYKVSPKWLIYFILLSRQIKAAQEMVWFHVRWLSVAEAESKGYESCHLSAVTSVQDLPWKGITMYKYLFHITLFTF